VLTRRAQAKELLKKFQNMKPSDPDFDFTIETLFNALKEHIKDEEQDDLPKLEEVLSREDSKSLASDFERTKKFVPTRSHPSAPDKPVSPHRVM
jgi:hemerythrin-like domain-containing protein